MAERAINEAKGPLSYGTILAVTGLSSVLLFNRLSHRPAMYRACARA